MPEVRRLLHALAAESSLDAARLRWSRWRRSHQATARRCHTTRRALIAPPGTTGLIPRGVPGTPPLTEAAWAQLAPALTAPPRRGKRRWHPRRLLEGILWVMHSGGSWREVPARFAPWHAVYERHARWRRDGTWDHILTVLLTYHAPT